MHPPLTYQPGKDEAERAGRELLNPLQPTPANLERGKIVWTQVCSACHGAGAKGDGGVIPRFPNPPNLVIEKYRNYPDGRIFHVATFGGPEKMMKGLGDIVTQDDRWRAVLHLRELQKASLVKAPVPAAAPLAATTPGAPAAPVATATPVPATTGAKP
jgi:mono/diheme cytochrome c family protein